MPAHTMPAKTGLDRQEVQRFWEQTNPALLTLLKEMEARESWVLHEGEDAGVVEGLEAVLPNFCQTYFVDSLDAPERVGLLATLVGYVGAAQFVAFLMQSENIRDGVIKRMAYALRNSDEPSGEAGVFADLFLERLQLVLSSDLKRHVFSEQRFAEVAAVINQVTKMRRSNAPKH